jgi:hypothetical protein
MALSSAEQARLDSLIAARDLLMSGRAVGKVQSGGRSKEFAQANMEDLKAEIRGLEARASTSGRQRGSITFRFRS